VLEFDISGTIFVAEPFSLICKIRSSDAAAPIDPKYKSTFELGAVNEK
jgi:hypothetical protein